MHGDAFFIAALPPPQIGAAAGVSFLMNIVIYRRGKKWKVSSNL
jgi:hypothetical protein